jgi:hypothetical protein
MLFQFIQKMHEEQQKAQVWIGKYETWTAIRRIKKHQKQQGRQNPATRQDTGLPQILVNDTKGSCDNGWR